MSQVRAGFAILVDGKIRRVFDITVARTEAAKRTADATRNTLTKNADGSDRVSVGLVEYDYAPLGEPAVKMNARILKTFKLADLLPVGYWK